MNCVFSRLLGQETFISILKPVSLCLHLIIGTRARRIANTSVKCGLRCKRLLIRLKAKRCWES